MRIGYDAKRAYHNGTGLGHYSRTLLRSLATQYPQHRYLLFNPKPSSVFQFNDLSNTEEILPGNFFSKMFSSAWRSNWVKKDLLQHHVDLYHGLSHEIPAGIERTPIPTVVTMHDLIHERYPDQYPKIDVVIYRKKFRNAAANANRIIAISQQTKNDLVEIYQADPHKIDVCYQSCNPSFALPVSTEEKMRIKKKYSLPDAFFLYVGSVIERKNLLTICKSLFLLRNENTLPLVVIGNGGKYLQQVKDFVLQHGLHNKVIFLSEHPQAQTGGYRTAEDFPAIYQQALAMIYPSFFEGFGIPVLEALYSRLPVITSNVSCLPEAGGAAACYVDPSSAQELADAMRKVYRDEALRQQMIAKGIKHASQFSPEKCAAAVMDVYQKIVQ